MRRGHEDHPDKDTKTDGEAGRLPYMSEHGEIVM